MNKQSKRNFPNGFKVYLKVYLKTLSKSGLGIARKEELFDKMRTLWLKLPQNLKDYYEMKSMKTKKKEQILQQDVRITKNVEWIELAAIGALTSGLIPADVEIETTEIYYIAYLILTLYYPEYLN